MILFIVFAIIVVFGPHNFPLLLWATKEMKTGLNKRIVKSQVYRREDVIPVYYTK